MKNILSLLLLFCVLFFSSCASKDEERIELENSDLELQMIESYNQGLKALREGDVLFAVKNFNNVENLYPQSIWAPRSILMSAYAYYTQDYYGDAIFELERYIKNYPSSEDLDYAYFLLAVSYYELIVDEKKDLAPLEKSRKNFVYIIENFPNTDFALDAKFKILLIDNILAAKEIYIAKYYLERDKWIPAINRFKTVVEDYGETEYVVEALHRLVEVNYKIGLTNEAKKYAAILGYNYQSSEWYKMSYKIFNTQYSDPVLQIKKEKKKIRTIIFDKFKSLF